MFRVDPETLAANERPDTCWPPDLWRHRGINIHA